MTVRETFSTSNLTAAYDAAYSDVASGFTGSPGTMPRLNGTADDNTNAWTDLAANNITASLAGFTTAAPWAGVGTASDQYRLTFNGTSDYFTVANGAGINFTASMTASAWVSPASVTAGVTQSLLSKWDLNTSFAAGDFSFFNAATVNAGATGYQSLIFDGRYVYFVPLGAVAHGKILRYDTQASFSAAGSYTVFDAATVNASAKGFLGASFDGRYVYFVPWHNGAHHGNILRYDTQASFSAAGSYTVFNAATVNANAIGLYGAMFDGRYIYFVPFTTGGGTHGNILRYDTQASFSAAGSYTVFDATTVNANAKGFIGASFDGRYIYFVPYNNGTSGNILRYDTQASFSAAGSYTVFDATTVNASAKGFVGGTFDGRYIYFVPHHNGAYHGTALRYDTEASFTADGSYSVLNLASINAAYVGYAGAVYANGHVYMAPYGNGGTTGNVARYKAHIATSAYELSANTVVSDGLGSARLGPSASIQTTNGVYSVSSPTTLTSDSKIDVTYDGSTLALYINGAQKASTAATGNMLTNSNDLLLGKAASSNGLYLNGGLSATHLYSSALTSTEVQQNFAATANSFRATPVSNIETTGLVLHLDAANAKDGLWPYANGCATADLNWVDLDSSGLTGQLTNFAACGASSGWNGTGTTADPYRISIATDAWIKQTPVVDLTATWSAEVWFKYPLYVSASGYNTLIRGSTNDHQTIVQRSNMHLGVFDNAGGTNFRDSTFVMSSLGNGWHHLVAVATGGTTTFYIDGALAGNAIPVVSTTDVYAIGNFQGGTQAWGEISIFRMYSAGLTLQQIKQNCHAEKARFQGATCAAP